MSKRAEAAKWGLLFALLTLGVLHAMSGAPKPPMQVSYLAG